MANVEQVKGYVGPQPIDPKKDVVVDKKRFQEELNKKVQAGSEAEKQDQQKKKHLAKSGNKEDEEEKIIHEVILPQVDVAFSAYMEDDSGAAVQGSRTSRIVASSGLGAKAPLGAFDEDLSHIKEDFISTSKNVYTAPPPPQAVPVVSPPPPPPVEEAPTPTPAPVSETPAPAPPPTPEAPPAPLTLPPTQQTFTDESPEPDAPLSPPSTANINQPASSDQTEPSNAPAHKAKEAKKKAADVPFLGIPKKESFKEKQFRKKLEKAKAAEEATSSQKTPQGEPLKAAIPPPTPQTTQAAQPQVMAGQVGITQPSLTTPLKPGTTVIPPGKVGAVRSMPGVSEAKAVQGVEEKGEGEFHPDSKKKEAEEVAAQGGVQATGQMSFAGIAAIQKAAPTPYSALSPQIRELFDKMVGMITIQSQTGVTTTTVTVSLPNSPLNGVQIVLQQFDTARHSFNIQLEGSPEQLNLLNANVNELAAAFAGGKYAFSANILTPQLITKSPHLIHRKEAGGEKGEKQQK